jgi:hypothetical protein
MPFEKIIYYIILIIIALFGAATYKKLTVPFKLLVVLMGINLIVEAAILVCAKLFHNNLPIFHIVCIYECIFYMLIFYRVFKNKTVKNIIFSIAIIVPAFTIVNAFVFQPYMTTVPSNAIFVSNIIYTILAMLLYREMLLNGSQISLFKQSVFWFNTALLFFSVTIFFYLGIVNYLIKHKQHGEILAYFDEIVNIIFYWALGYAIYLNIREQKLQYE